MIEIKFSDDHIVSIAATTFWGPDGKPISVKQFIENMYGDLPEIFKDEDELLRLWSDPDARKALMERLSERGYDAVVLLQIQEALDATASDLFDVLSHIAYARGMRTREHRAEVGKRRIEDNYDPKLAAFLGYVLGSYVNHGVSNLDRAKLKDYAKLKYGTLADCAADLGGMEAVVSGYLGFQRHLYTPSN